MFAGGKGTNSDIPKGYMWIALSAEQGNDFAKEKLAYLVKKASPRQVTEGERLLAEWKRNR